MIHDFEIVRGFWIWQDLDFLRVMLAVEAGRWCDATLEFASRSGLVPEMRRIVEDERSRRRQIG